jgi:hypothetical protein
MAVIVSLIGLGASNLLGLIVGLAVVNTRQEERHRENQRRFAALEEKLGNGSPGVLVRRSELDLMVRQAEGEHERIYERLERLESGR